MKRKIIKAAILSALLSLIIILSTVTLCGCAANKIAVGKYYSENNVESYIEILEDNQILFVNVDFSELDETLKAFGSPLTVADVAEKLSQPQKYESIKGSNIEGYNYYIFVLYDGTEKDGGLALTLHRSKSNTILCFGEIYSLQNPV
ncbi:MAG: hypothetical protein NC131_14125 [Roseburia sp.]|nr:hypothetical protein [Roseburia sp.]